MRVHLLLGDVVGGVERADDHLGRGVLTGAADQVDLKARGKDLKQWEEGLEGRWNSASSDLGVCLVRRVVGTGDRLFEFPDGHRGGEGRPGGHRNGQAKTAARRQNHKKRSKSLSVSGVVAFQKIKTHVAINPD